MTKRTILSKLKLQNTLINTRRMTSLIDRDIALGTSALKRETVNWVPMWVDWGHSVRSDCDTATAIRAITDCGELLWYVRHDTKKHGYHAQSDDPFQAIDLAMDAWRKRAVARASWDQVKALSHDLILGRKRLSVTRQDAENSALCSLGIDWFSARFKLTNKQQISGRTAALLMKVEPQLGFVIHEAAVRENMLHVQAASLGSSRPQAASEAS